MSKILIRNGRIYQYPVNQIDAVGSLCIADGKILEVLHEPAGFHSETVIDAAGQIAVPDL